MSHLSKHLLLVITLLCLSSCATTRHVATLPPGSTVALISGLDDVVTYHYVGETVYLNSDYQYPVASFHPEAGFVQPITTSLKRSGYKVLFAHVPANSPLTSPFNLSGPLSYNQIKYIARLFKNRHIDRVIILAKAPAYDANFPNDNQFGYGYIQRNGLMYHGTQVFAGMSIRVVTLDDLNIYSSEQSLMGTQVLNNYFDATAKRQNPRAIKFLNTWMKSTFAPIVLESMRKMGALVH